LHQQPSIDPEKVPFFAREQLVPIRAAILITEVSGWHKFGDARCYSCS
jgi:hypothetical protein